MAERSLCWLLLTYGVTLIVTGSRVAAPLRSLISKVRGLGTFIVCPMCVGFWVGVAVSVAGVGPAHVVPWPWYARALADGFSSSAWCWTAHVVLAKLGADEL